MDQLSTLVSGYSPQAAVPVELINYCFKFDPQRRVERLRRDRRILQARQYYVAFCHVGTGYMAIVHGPFRTHKSRCVLGKVTSASSANPNILTIPVPASYMSEPVQMLYLPDTMANWPWTREINPHYEEVSAESNAWFHNFNAFTKRSQLAFDKCDFG